MHLASLTHFHPFSSISRKWNKQKLYSLAHIRIRANVNRAVSISKVNFSLKSMRTTSDRQNAGKYKIRVRQQGRE